MRCFHNAQRVAVLQAGGGSRWCSFEPSTPYAACRALQCAVKESSVIKRAECDKNARTVAEAHGEARRVCVVIAARRCMRVRFMSRDAAQNEVPARYA